MPPLPHSSQNSEFKPRVLGRKACALTTSSVDREHHACHVKDWALQSIDLDVFERKLRISIIWICVSFWSLAIPISRRIRGWLIVNTLFRDGEKNQRRFLFDTKLETRPLRCYRTLLLADGLEFSKEMTNIIDSSPSSKIATEYSLNRLLGSGIPRTYTSRPGLEHLSDLVTIWPESLCLSSFSLSISILVAGALGSIEQAVEKFRKNMISPIDGVIILFQMKILHSHNFFFINTCAGFTKKLNVSRYLSHISQIY